jgi:hypothetical protein
VFEVLLPHRVDWHGREASGSGEKAREEEPARLMDELGLCDKYLDSVIFEKEDLWGTSCRDG